MDLTIRNLFEADNSSVVETNTSSRGLLESYSVTNESGVVRLSTTVIFDRLITATQQPVPEGVVYNDIDTPRAITA